MHMKSAPCTLYVPHIVLSSILHTKRGEYGRLSVFSSGWINARLSKQRASSSYLRSITLAL